MTSIITNSAARVALASLRLIESTLDKTEGSASTGLRVRTASDNAAYWSIATTLRSDMASRSAAADALNLSVSLVDTAYNGVTQSLDIVNRMKGKFLMAATATDAERAKLEIEIVALRSAFVSVVKSSSFAGENWLYKSTKTQSNTRSLVTGFTRTAVGSVTVQKTTVDLTTVFLIDSSIANSPLGILSRSYSSTSGFSTFAFSRHAYVSSGTGVVSAVGSFNSILASARILDLITQDLTSAASQLGSIRSGLDIQKAFSQELENVDTRSLGRLVDADMNETAARTQGLQVRLQLGYQALSIANAAPDAILQLFR